MTNIRAKLAWTGVAMLGAVSLGIVALSRGETINAVVARLGGDLLVSPRLPVLRPVHRRARAAPRPEAS